jgi:glycosylphosphatidylinositol transamidase (GPIT) subunit GPI8
MLAAFACHYIEHSTVADKSQTSNLNSQFNQAIYDITFPNADANLSASVWNASAMALYLQSLKNGLVPKFRGASGNIAFDAETCTAAAGTTYVHWQIMDGQIHNMRYFSSDGSHRAGEATVAWNYLYDENTAQQRFAAQALDQDAGIDYAPLTGQYALIVHASEGFTNYRHLADALNVYQLLRHNGFDDDHIILIADRSIADNPMNPEPGIIRTSSNGPDLMAGALIDYDAAKLTAADVANILAGQQTDRLPVVIPPDAGHNVFLYWSGHGMNREQGGADAFAWRNTSSDFTAALMKQTVTRMQQQSAYRKLLIVAEPCFGECVVSGLEGIPGVLAITGANAKEQSWADNWNRQGSFWMCDRFSSNFVSALTDDAAQTYRDLFLYCAQHTLGSHARIINAAHFGNLYRTSPKEFVKK